MASKGLSRNSTDCWLTDWLLHVSLWPMRPPPRATAAVLCARHAGLLLAAMRSS
jgi:hypothetical protein